MRTMVHGELTLMAEFEIDAGAVIPIHDHPNEQTGYLLSGRLDGRGGPGLGGILPSQADYFQAVKGGGHGDYRLPVLAPASVQEAVDLTILAFDLAEKYSVKIDFRPFIQVDAVTAREFRKSRIGPTKPQQL